MRAVRGRKEIERGRSWLDRRSFHSFYSCHRSSQFFRRANVIPMRPSTALSAVLTLTVALVAACASHEDATTTPLANTYWRLVEAGGQPLIGEGGRELHLQFGDSARVTGWTGCNRFSGPFTLDGPLLHFGPATITRMACADPRLGEQEQAFTGALSGTKRHRIAGDTLILIGDGGDLARLVAAPRPARD